MTTFTEKRKSSPGRREDKIVTNGIAEEGDMGREEWEGLYYFSLSKLLCVIEKKPHMHLLL